MSQWRQLNATCWYMTSNCATCLDDLSVVIYKCCFMFWMQRTFRIQEENGLWHCCLLCLVAFGVGRPVYSSSLPSPLRMSAPVHLYTSGRVCSYMCALNVAVCHASTLFLLIKFGGYICMSSPSVGRSFIFSISQGEKSRGILTKQNPNYSVSWLIPVKDLRSDHPNIKILIEADNW